MPIHCWKTHVMVLILLSVTQLACLESVSSARVIAHRPLYAAVLQYLMFMFYLNSLQYSSSLPTPFVLKKQLSEGYPVQESDTTATEERIAMV